MQRILFDFGVAAVYLTILVILVAAHELGHYVAARAMGMGVDEFSIGFGPKAILVWARRKYKVSGTDEVEETRFTVRPFPLGGFVKIKGMSYDQEESHSAPGSFFSKSPAARLLVLFAGPLASVLFGVLILIPYYKITGDQAPNLAPMIGVVVPNMPAGKAGMLPGDRVISINSKPITTFYQMIQIVRVDSDTPLNFVVQRGQMQKKMVIQPQFGPTPSSVFGPDLQPSSEKKIQGIIGVVWESKHIDVSLPVAIAMAFEAPIKAFAGLADGIAHPAVLKDEVGGPESMVRLTAEATKTGFGEVAVLAALLSISLGVFNLLPFPPLDGGLIMMTLAEIARGGRKLSVRAQNLVVAMGMAVVGVLVMCVIAIDFQRWRGQSDDPPPVPTYQTSKTPQK